MLNWLYKICGYFGVADEEVTSVIQVISLPLFLAFLIIIIVLIINQVKLNKRYKMFMSDADGKSLDELLSKKIERIDSFNDDMKDITRKIYNIQNKQLTSIQKVGLVKYNAFSEMGGNVSFALALLSEEDDGFVMNSVYSREGCYTYIKEIVKGDSNITLSDEEKTAVQKAMNNVE
ncbi:MAG: DUF4446 family protein [Lachnospiraceae bacterium]|nr:DUF4446 family protein [Lachnospiraceae bacterium]